MKPVLTSLLFSSKLFIAAMLAYAVAVSIGLSQPYWSIVTCCVVMNSTTGEIRSKAVYRFVRTIAAGLMSLLLTGLFPSIPLLLVAVCGGVATIALTCSFLDRTPRGYGYLLCGLTHPRSDHD